MDSLQLDICDHAVLEKSEQIETYPQVYRLIITFAVLKTSFLQSGKMLTDHAGRWYVVFLNTTVAPFLSSVLEIIAEQAPDDSSYTSTYKIVSTVND